MNTGSAGIRTTWAALAEVLAWLGSDPVRVGDARDVMPALCSRAVEASVAVGFHPTSAVRDPLSGCETRLVPVTGPAIAAILRRHPDDRPAATHDIPADVEAFGVSSYVETTDPADPRVVGAQNPALARPRGMIGGGWNAPPHPAAAAVYGERGLIR